MHLDKHPDGTVTLRVHAGYGDDLAVSRSKACGAALRAELPLNKTRLWHLVWSALDALNFIEDNARRKPTRRQIKREMEQDKAKYD